MDKIQIIKDLVKKKNLIYEDFAKKIGKSKPTVVNYFNRKSKIDIDTIEKIAEVLGVPVSYFFDGGNDNEVDKKNLEILLRLIKYMNAFADGVEMMRKMSNDLKTSDLEARTFMLYAQLNLNDINHLREEGVMGENLYNILIRLKKERKDWLKKNDISELT